MAANPTIDELTKLLAKQQKLVDQLLNAQQTMSRQLKQLSFLRFQMWSVLILMINPAKTSKIGSTGAAYNEYSKFCLPKKPTEFDFSETSAQLKKAERRAVQLPHASIALKSPKDVELRKRILGKLTTDGKKANYDNVVSDLQMFLSTIAEAKAIERPSHFNFLAVNRRPFQKKEPNKSPTQRLVGVVAMDMNRYVVPIQSQHAENVQRLDICRILNALNQPSRLVEAPVDVNGKPIDFVFDPGAEITVIHEESHHQIGRLRLIQCSESAKYHDGTECTLLGKGFTKFIGNRQQADGKDRMKSQTPTKKDMTLHDLQCNFPHVFAEGLGHCTKAKAHLELKVDAIPVFCRPRPVPFNTRLIVQAELDRLLAQKVIRPIDHTSWAAPIMVVKKANGAARVCADFSTGLNNALLLNQHPLPLPKDIFSKLNGGRIFSQIDLKDAYLQVELDDKSKELCTIATHRGTFQYLRLPFGVKSAPGIFQSIMDSILADCPFAFAYLDDMIVEVFKRIGNFGFRNKPDKCSFNQKQIKYLGFVIDKNGRRPVPSKIKAIAEMPVPTNVSELRSFLGMINHYQQFVKNMRFLRQPLDELLKQDVAWATNADKLLQEVKGFILSQWPNKVIMTEDITQFHRRREALSFENGCIMYADRIVVPASLQTEVLKMLHCGHPGMKRMKSLARQHMYWPGIDQQIEEVMYLIIVDAHSKWLEVFEMRSTGSAATIEQLRSLCARFGLPETLVTDNGTQFSSNERNSSTKMVE
ncbi:hypothetical protein niasHT_033632 [Heterodera trifolii]|uniref:RNA-directed DNA polymerase n=1 Tax=Heterodera trifolii TaxID=157864 RepID=A0ABD2IH22_9BILA